MRWSISRAITNVAAITAADTSARLQNSIGPSLFDFVDGFPAREPLVEAVPERDALLADAPAEQDLASLVERGEVEQPLVEVLHLHARLVELGHAALDLRGNRLQLGLELCEVARAQAAAVALDDDAQLRALRVRLAPGSPEADDAFGQGAHDGERVVRVLRGEDPGWQGWAPALPTTIALRERRPAGPSSSGAA